MDSLLDEPYKASHMTYTWPIIWLIRQARAYRRGGVSYLYPMAGGSSGPAAGVCTPRYAWVRYLTRPYVNICVHYLNICVWITY